MKLIDALKIVQIEIEHGEPSSTSHIRECMSQLLSKQYAVGQVGEGIVVGHVRDLLLRVSTRSDVFVGCDPSSIGHRLV